MRAQLLEFLICPSCRANESLKLDHPILDGDDIITGTLICSSCSKEYLIESGIPRFVIFEQDYCKNFGFQWEKWRTLQVDRLSDHKISEERFLSDSRWPRNWFKGKLILDAGCGAGRFTDIAAKLGAQIIAVDISSAIDACKETTKIYANKNGNNVHYIQASLFQLPLRDEIFDGIYCMGVIQHTPDPVTLMRDMPRFLKTGGRLVYNFYEEGIWRKLQVLKYGLRIVTRHLSITSILTLSRILVYLLFPLTKWLNSIPKIHLLNHFIPIAAVHHPQLTIDQQRAWTLLDTFDWYGAKYEKRQRHRNVGVILADAGLTEIFTEPGLAWAKKPKKI